MKRRLLPDLDKLSAEHSCFAVAAVAGRFDIRQDRISIQQRVCRDMFELEHDA